MNLGNINILFTLLLIFADINLSEILQIFKLDQLCPNEGINYVN